MWVVPAGGITSFAPWSIWIQSELAMSVMKPAPLPSLNTQRIRPRPAPEGILTHARNVYFVMPVGSMGTTCRLELIPPSSPPPSCKRLRRPLCASLVVARRLPRQPPTPQGGASSRVPSSKPGLIRMFSAANGACVSNLRQVTAKSRVVPFMWLRVMSHGVDSQFELSRHDLRRTAGLHAAPVSTRWRHATRHFRSWACRCASGRLHLDRAKTRNRALRPDHPQRDALRRQRPTARRRRRGDQRRHYCRGRKTA